MKRETLLTYLILSLLFLSIFGMHFRFDPVNTDLWIHLTPGKIIYEQKSLPKTDVLTFTRQGEGWVLHEWLYQICLYLLYLATGLLGLLFFKASCIVVGMILLFMLLRRNFYAGVTVTFLISCLVLQFSVIRPHVVSWIFLLFTLYLVKYIPDKISDTKLWIFPVLFFLWGNIHPLHLLGLVIVALYLTEHFWKTKEKKYIGVIIASIIASALNPLGIKMFTFPFSVTSTYIREWMPFSIQGMWFWIYAIFIVIGILFFIKYEKWRFSDTLLFILLTYLGLTSRRHVALAFLLLTPLIVERMRFLDKPWFKIRSKYKDYFILVLLLIAMVWSFGWQADSMFHEDALPNEEVDLILGYDISGKIFNNWGYGPYLGFSLYPHNLLYIDSRVETMGDELIEEYYALGTTRKSEILDVLDAYDITIVIVRHKMGLTEQLLSSPEWKPIYFNDIRASFVRNTKETASVPEFDVMKYLDRLE